MRSARYFISIDLCNGYWQCRIADKDIPKTAFLVRYGIYKWVVMPIGLMNAPATFIQTMNNFFSDMLDSGMAVFLDDTLMYSCMVKEHFMLLKKILVLYFSKHYTITLSSAASYTIVQYSLALRSYPRVCTSVT